MLQFWKPLPEIPSLENFIQAQTPRPFETTQPPPLEPVWPEEQTKCLNELTESVKSRGHHLVPGFIASHLRFGGDIETEIQQRYEQSLADYEQQLKTAQAEWEAQETERILVETVTSGDLDEIGTAAWRRDPARGSPCRSRAPRSAGCFSTRQI